MARKISVVSDEHPAIPTPKPERVTQSQPECPPPVSEEIVDYDAVEERESEIDELVYDFVCGLIGAETPEECDMISYGLQDEIELLKDEFEEVLAKHGIIIHRPVIVEDDDGNEVVINSMYGDS